MGPASSSGRAHVGARQRARWRRRRVLLAEDVQPLNVGAVPSVTRPDILGNQGAQCVEREVVGLGFARRQSCAEGVRPSANWAGM